MLEKIISGGQTGADQAVLDIVIELGLPHGGRLYGYGRGKKERSNIYCDIRNYFKSFYFIDSVYFYRNSSRKIWSLGMSSLAKAILTTLNAILTGINVFIVSVLEIDQG